MKSSDLQEKVDKLEARRRAGIISNDEFNAACAEIEQQNGSCPKPRPQNTGVFFKYVILFLIWWSVILGGLYIFIGRKEPLVMAGAGTACLLSLLICAWVMLRSWTGQVIEIRHESKKYAIIRTLSGKNRKEKMTWQQWKVGDWLDKRRGDMNINIL